MKKSDLCQIADLFDERLDLKFDEKLKGFATKTDLGQFATKDDLKSFATKSDLDRFAIKDDLKSFATKDDLKQFATKSDLDRFATKDDLVLVIESIAINTNKSLEEMEVKMNERFDGIDEELIKRATRSEIFDKWDNNISQMSCDIDSLKYLHKDEWGNLSREINK